MTKVTNPIDLLTQIDEYYTITHCTNGYLIDISGRDSTDDFASVKVVVLNHGELLEKLIKIDNRIFEQRQTKS